ncbi:hypothetical protein Hanom_Chr05g00419901 [Helianthus anomalus]
MNHSNDLFPHIRQNLYGILCTTGCNFESGNGIPLTNEIGQTKTKREWVKQVEDHPRCIFFFLNTYSLLNLF